MKRLLSGIIIVYFLGIPVMFSQQLSKADSLINKLTAEDIPVSKEKRLEILTELTLFYKIDYNEKSLEYGKIALELTREIKDQDTEMEILNTLAFVNNHLCNYSEADNYFHELLEILERIDDKPQIANIIFRIARNYYDWSDYAKANEYYQVALIKFEYLKNNKGTINCIKGLGTICLNWGDYQKAQNYFKVVLKYYEETGDTQGMAGTYNSLGVLYQDMGELDRSLNYYMKALSIFEEKAQNWNVVNMTLHIGDIYLKKKDYNKALDFYQKADTLGRIIGHKKLISITLSNIGEVYNQMGEYLKALDCQTKALGLKTEIGDNKRITISLYELGLINSNLGNNEDALGYLLKSLEYAKMVNFKDQQKKCYKALSFVYSNIGENKKALDYRIKYDVLKDSLFNIETHKNIANLRLKYETEKKEKENKILSMEVLKEQYYRNLMIIILLIFIISAAIILIFISNRLKIRKKNNEILINKNKKILKQKEEFDTLFNELMVSEKRYKSIFEHATVGLYRTTPDGRVIFANPFIIEMLKYPSLDVLVNENLEDRDYPRLAFKKMLEEEGVIMGLEGTWERYDKTKIFVKESAWVIKDENDEILFYDGLVEDITDRKIAELALKDSEKKLREANKILTDRNIQIEKAREQAESANQSKSMFVANISHEIRTPLNAIIGFTDLLEGVIVDKRQKRYVESIKSSSRNLLSLINDILDMSKIQAGKIELEYEPVNPHSLFNDIKQIFDQKIIEKGLDFIIDVSEEIPNSLILDEIKIRQILFNLIGNAIKFTEKGYIKLAARKILSNKKKNTIDFLISVEDTGIGISKIHQKKIFEPFHQNEGQSQKLYGGTGLGLSITKRLVEIMEGEIIVESIINKGSKFDIIFKNVSVSTVLPEKYSKKEIDYTSIAFEKSKILIADDMKINRDLIKIEKLSDEILEKLPEVIRKIEKELVPVWKKVKEDHFIQEIKDFGELVKNFGADNKIIDLENFGANIIDDAENFDVEKTNYKLNLFPELIKSLRDLNKKR